MLIVISGVETVHKKFFARSFLMSLVPDFTLSRNYTMNFKHHPYEIFDPSGKLVYSHVDGRVTNEIMLDLDNDGILDPEGMEIFNEADSRYTEHMLNNLRDNHFMETFSDPWYDLGFIKTIDAPMNGQDINFDLIHPHSYDDILNNYNNRKIEVHVITGIFGKHFIEQIRKDLGEENVKVYNIIRNPSVAFLLNEKESYIYTLKKPTKSRDRAMDRRKLEQSIINAMIIKDVPGVNTLRYEDILTSGELLIEGQTVIPPEPLLEDDNGYLTKWELTNHVPLNIVNEQDVLDFNNHFQSYELGLWEFDSNGTDLKFVKLFDTLSTTEDEEILSLFPDNVIGDLNIIKSFPSNIFTELSYTPLTYEEMTKPI